MGSPVSAVIANLYMESFEQQAITSLSYTTSESGNATLMALSPSWITETSRAFYSIWTTSNLPSASPCIQRTTTNSFTLTLQFKKHRTPASPTAYTGNLRTPISAQRIRIPTTCNQWNAVLPLILPSASTSGAKCLVTNCSVLSKERKHLSSIRLSNWLFRNSGGNWGEFQILTNR